MPSIPDHSSDTDVIAATVDWLEQAVIGLNLCPFAKAVHVKNQIRYHVSHARNAEDLTLDLVDQLQALLAADPEQVDTTLLIHPWVLNDFLDYNDFLEVADAALLAQSLDGVIQIASFHPDYRFADSAEDIENYSNRSPWPMLHLLREDSISRAVDTYPDTDEIVERNIATLRRLGLQGWRALMRRSE